jgi:carboxymethylenebutenolidase
MADLFDITAPGQTLYYGTAGDSLVVILHDWYGRLPALEPLGQATARNGFRVAVPDLYHGVATLSDETAESLMDQLSADAALALIHEVIERARSEGSRRVGIIGFSMGGWLALGAAQLGLCDAVVAYYASLVPEEHDVLPCPVMLHLAEYDSWPPGGEPESFMSRLLDHGTPVQPYSYPGTQHSFANASLPDRVDPDAAALAFARSINFLDHQLRY